MHALAAQWVVVASGCLYSEVWVFFLQHFGLSLQSICAWHRGLCAVFLPTTYLCASTQPVSPPSPAQTFAYLVYTSAIASFLYLSTSQLCRKLQRVLIAFLVLRPPLLRPPIPSSNYLPGLDPHGAKCLRSRCARWRSSARSSTSLSPRGVKSKEPRCPGLASGRVPSLRVS